MLVFSLTSNLGDLKGDLNQDGKWSQNVLTRVVERVLFPILALVIPVEPGRPFDPDLIFLRNVNLYVTSLILVLFGVVAPDILSTKLDAGLFCGWTNESDQGLNVDDFSKIRKAILFEMSKVMFGSGLELNITKIGASISKFLRGFARVVENQNLSSRIAKHDWDLAFLAFVGLDLVEHLAVTFGVETQNSPIVN